MEKLIPLPKGYRIGKNRYVGYDFLDDKGAIVTQHPKNNNAKRSLVWEIYKKGGQKMNDPIEWEFGVPASKVDLERLYSEACNITTIMALVYYEQLKLKAPVTYARYKKWIEDNHKWTGCIKLL